MPNIETYMFNWVCPVCRRQNAREMPEMPKKVTLHCHFCSYKRDDVIGTAKQPKPKGK